MPSPATRAPARSSRTSRGSKSRNHWSFEVVQARVYGWNGARARDQNGEHTGIFLEIYLGSTRPARCCPRWGRRGTAKRRRTEIVAPEAQVMTWRRSDDNNNPVPLFTLGCNLQLEELPLVVDVFRKVIRRNAEQPDKKPVRVCRMTGSCSASALGLVTLYPTWQDARRLLSAAADLEIDERIVPEVELELRLASSRMFTLENARPCWLDRMEKLAPLGRQPRSPSKSAALKMCDLDSSSDELVPSPGSEEDGPHRRFSLLSVASTSRTVHVRRATDLFFEWIPTNLRLLWERVWPIEDDDLAGQYEVLPLMEAEFRRDCVVFFNTLYPRIRGASFISLRDAAFDRGSPIAFPRAGNGESELRVGGVLRGEVYDDYSPRIMFLKRLFLCFAVCGVKYTEERGMGIEREGTWPFPLAAILGHGSRVLIRLEDVTSSEFLNFLLCGDAFAVDWKESGVPFPLERRAAATHSVELVEGENEEQGACRLVERRLSVMSVADTVQNVSDGFRKKHLGLNLPIGGVGNPTALHSRKCVVGFNGFVVRPTQLGEPMQMLKRKESKRSFATHSSMSNESMEEEQASKKNKGTIARKTKGLLAGSDSLVLPALRRGATGASGMPSSESVEEFALSVTVSPEGAKLRVAAPGLNARMRETAGDCTTQSSLRSALSKDDQGDVVTQPADISRSTANEEDFTSPRSVEPTFHSSVGRDSLKEAAPREDSKETVKEDPSPQDRRPSRPASEASDELCSEETIPSQPKAREQAHCSSKSRRNVAWDWVPLASVQGGHMYIRADDFGERVASLSRVRGGPVNSKEAIRRSLFALTDPHQVPLKQASVRRALDLRHHSAGEVLFCEAIPIVRKVTFSHGPDVPKVAGDTMNLCTVRSMPDLTTPSPLYHSARRGSATSRSSGSPDWVDVSLGFSGNNQDFSSEISIPRHSLAPSTSGAASDYNFTDENWARGFFQKGGSLPPPPTENALKHLLRICGMDTQKFGSGNTGSFDDLLEDLTAEGGRRSRLCLDSGWPVHIVEKVILKLRRMAPKNAGASPGSRERNYQVLVEETSPKADMRSEQVDQNDLARKLPTEGVGWREDWKESAFRGAERRLRSMLGGKSGEKVRDMLIGPQHVVHEVRRTLSSADGKVYQGIQTFEQYHLVTFMVKFDAQSGSSNSTSSTRSMAQASTGKLSWVAELDLDGVAGSHFWSEARVENKKHSVSSVLLGLEGSAPGCESPFGMAHDATGASGKVSAVGNRKWRAYKTNCARDVPNEVDGIRMTITRQMFDEFMKTCSLINLMEASADMTETAKSKGSASLPRYRLEERYMEQELFRRVLGGSMMEARRAVEWMKEYRSTRKTPANYDRACPSAAQVYVRGNVLVPKDYLTNHHLAMMEATRRLSAPGIGTHTGDLRSARPSLASFQSVPNELIDLAVRVRDALPPFGTLGKNLPTTLKPRWSKTSSKGGNSEGLR